MININKITISSCLLVNILCFCHLVIAEERNEALDLSVEDLLKVQVTSVAKKAQSLNDAPAAVFVITNEDIKRSGATSIPDALRLAPGLDVARIDSNKWAVSSRGFNGRLANKLLVLIDGRSAYTRSFAGVYWENQDVMMEDVDRIEVIRGPGATMWGANAVNGVINIITKNSSKTQGALLNVGGGTQEQGFGSFRYGAKLSKDTTARVYVKGFNRGENTLLSGGGAGDDWNKVQGGFRLDSQLTPKDTLTFQGDIYKSNINQLSYYPQVTSPFQVTENDYTSTYGGNLLSRLQHTFSPTSDYYLQLFYDTYTRNEIPIYDSRSTLDVDFQHRFALLDWQEIIWGVNYRFGHDRIKANNILKGAPVFFIDPTSVNDQLVTAFIQDELTLIDNSLWLTIGSKFEHNDYSGFEGQPSARIMWAPHNQHRLWAGVSRAVRTPSRADQDLKFLFGTIGTLPIALWAQGSPTFKAEEVITYEVGYRTTFLKSISVDVTGFYNDYRDLRYAIQGDPIFDGASVKVPFNITNNQQGKTYGAEIAAIWQMLDWWRWDVNYSWLQTQLDANPFAQISISPSQRVSLRGALSPWPDVDLDFWFRYVSTNFAISELGNQYIKDYITLDLRLGWRPHKDIELSLVGQNLLASKHLEYVHENQTFPTAIDRGMYGKISWSF